MVLLGALRNSDLGTKGDMALTCNDLRIDVSGAGICAYEEQMLNLYQAASRGAMRNAIWKGDTLEADECTIWVSGNLTRPMQDFLRKVMPGVSIVSLELEEPLAVALTWLEGKTTSVRLCDLFAACGVKEWGTNDKRKLVRAIEEIGTWTKPNGLRSLVPLTT